MKKKCMWCGKTYEEHISLASDLAWARTPCMLRKSGFITKSELRGKTKVNIDMRKLKGSSSLT